TQTEVVRKQVPYTVTRMACGAWVDADEAKIKKVEYATDGTGFVRSAQAPVGHQGYDTPAPGRVFVEGAVVCQEVMYTTCRMEQQTEVRRVPYTVTRNVMEEVVKREPYTVTRMVPTNVDRIVQVTNVKLVQEDMVRQVPTTVMTMQQTPV